MDGLSMETGDLLGTVDGSQATWQGRVWHLIGELVPGEVDHVLMYVGPGSRFVEAGPRGVITFEMPGQHWDSVALFHKRGFLDSLHGVGYALADRGLTPDEQSRIRRSAADYCLEQAARRKPYNFVFANPAREDAFYCSQLVYCAYLQHGIVLKKPPEGLPITLSTVHPADVWRACRVRATVATAAKSQIASDVI